MTEIGRALLLPWLVRLRRGDGALPLLPVFYLFLAETTATTIVAWLLIYAALMSTLYAVNDLTDVEADRHNPKKDQRLVKLLAHRRCEVRRALQVLHLLLPGLVWLLRPDAVIWVIGLLGVNLAYSWRAKRIPIVDVIVVGVWGGMLVALPGLPLPLVIIAGWMTSISHLFQISEDYEADRATHATTTSVRFPRLTRALNAILATFLSAACWQMGQPYAAGLSLGPALSDWLPLTDTMAWQLARVSLASAWLILAVEATRNAV